MRVPLKQPHPTEIAYWAKNDVTILIRAAHWMTLMRATHWMTYFDLSKLNLVRANVLIAFEPYCDGSDCLALLRSEIPSGICARLRTVAASNNRDHTPWSLYYCLFAPHILWCYSSRTSRSWWTAHSKQRHRRSCNSTFKHSVSVIL